MPRVSRPPFLPGVAVLLLVGALSVVLVLEDPASVLWTGIPVHGYSSGGLAYYRYGGVEYTVDNTHQDPSVTTRVPTTVYLDRAAPDDTSRARIDGPTRWFIGAFVLVWFVAAGSLLVVGYARRLRRGRAS